MELETNPPIAEQVAKRALVLAAIGNRGLIENEPDEIEDPQESCDMMLEWLDEIGMSDEVEPEEWKVLQRPVNSLEMQTVANATWRLEGLGVLLWALGVYELPSHDDLVVPADLFDATGIYDNDESLEFLKNATLRSKEDLEKFHTYILMLHWRLREFRLRPQAMDFVEFSEDCWLGSFDVSRFEIIDRDVAIGGKSIINANPDLLGLCESIATERHIAANWLLGEHRLYSQIETHT
ncbi:MAG TPA: DUF4272 domain-containing protein [Planctomycetaceae bacterium]|nr:DUF4272 domain-containing protein [Planctomycetaceae bacterium]